jgi:hypothetical protein
MVVGMRGIAIGIVVLAGCSFSGNSKAGDDAGVTADGLAVVDGPVIDGPTPKPTPLFAASGTDLYQIDLAAGTSIKVGPVKLGATTVGALDGLAFDGTNLIGLDQNGANLIVIDPHTAVIHGVQELDIVGLGGMTVIPANEIGNGSPIVLAAAAGSLFRIAPATGSVTVVGNFESNHVFNCDLAWVHGHGLYITLKAPNDNIDLYRIDPTTASTLADVHGGYDNIQGLSGYHDQLWAVSKGGFVYQADLATGVLTAAMMDGPEYTEAAE